MSNQELPEGFEDAVKRAAVEHYEYRPGDALLKSLLDRNRNGRFAVEWVNGFLLGWDASQVMVLSGVQIKCRDLVASALHYLKPRHRHGTPRWALVSGMFGHGCGVSSALCCSFGYDPDEDLSTDPNYATDRKVLAHLKSLEGSTAWAMCGPLEMEREDISKALYRLKRKGLVRVKEGLQTYWVSC